MISMFQRFLYPRTEEEGNYIEAQPTTRRNEQGPIRNARVEPTICSLCSDRYQRPRQSVCICNHCSRPLCSDCMNDHIDELPKTITQFTHQLHQLEGEFQSKQKMVQEEVSKSTDEVIKYFQTYINGLMQAYHAILADVEKSKQDAKEYLGKVDWELQTIRTDIETLARETTFQPSREEALSTQLNQIQEKLVTYKVTRDIELPIGLPKYALKFECVPATTATTNESSETEPSNLQDDSVRSSNRQQRHHPYRSLPAAVPRRNISSRNGDTDRH